jgi:hypothetical protein
LNHKDIWKETVDLFRGWGHNVDISKSWRETPCLFMSA